jgi:hypothetical protein
MMNCAIGQCSRHAALFVLFKNSQDIASSWNSGVMIQPDQIADVRGAQDLHQQIQQSHDTAISLLAIIKELKEKCLSSLESLRHEHNQRQETNNANSEAAELLQVRITISYSIPAFSRVEKRQRHSSMKFCLWV